MRIDFSSERRLYLSPMPPQQSIITFCRALSFIVYFFLGGLKEVRTTALSVVVVDVVADA